MANMDGFIGKLLEQYLDGIEAILSSRMVGLHLAAYGDEIGSFLSADGNRYDADGIDRICSLFSGEIGEF